MHMFGFFQKQNNLRYMYIIEKVFLYRGIFSIFTLHFFLFFRDKMVIVIGANVRAIANTYSNTFFCI